jgi:two-component system LytT family response regulator
MSLPVPLRVLVVDDEAPARRKVLRLLQDEEGVEVVGEADGGEAAIAAVRKHSPDLVFLDVQMPGVDGFGVVRSIVDAKLALPRIIFVTAHDKFALRAFEVHAFDYLLKPVGEERFQAALGRARQQHEQATDAFASRLHTMLAQLHRERSFPERLLIHEDARALFVPVREISWIEADRNYLLQETLDPKAFVRINRGTLVRLDAIRELLPWFHGEYKVVLQDDTELRWSRRYISRRPELLKQR